MSKNEKKEEPKYKYFSYILYPESMPSGSLKRLKDTAEASGSKTIFYAILHDRDTDDSHNDCGTKALSAYKDAHPKADKAELDRVVDHLKKSEKWYKKAHYHVLAYYERSITTAGALKKMQRLLGGGAKVIGSKRVKPVFHVEGAVNYLPHKTPAARLDGKHEYTWDEVYKWGGDMLSTIDYSKLDKQNCLNVVKILIKLDKKMTAADYMQYANRGLEPYKSIRDVDDDLQHVALVQERCKAMGMTFTAQVELYEKQKSEVIAKLLQKKDFSDEEKSSLKAEYRGVDLMLKRAVYALESTKKILTAIDSDSFPSYQLFSQSYRSYRSIYLDYLNSKVE